MAAQKETLDFGQLAKSLEIAYDVAPDAIPAFRSRLKHLQRLGWPEGSNTGRGKAAPYSERMAKELIFAVELGSVGITPERAIELCRANLPALHRAADNGGKIDLPLTPNFGRRMPKSSIHLDIGNALSAVLG